jgi:hypothetical protein
MAKKPSKRERQIMNTMGLDYPTTKAVTEIGRLSGTHKYDVWIGREVSRNQELLNRAADFQFIIDWAKKDKPDIFKFSFDEAYSSSEEWHKNLPLSTRARIFEKDKDEERVIYVSKNKKYFFMLLKPEELPTEGDIMRNCVGSYKEKVIRGHSLIVSMRDMKNQPHVTIEIDTKTSTVTQVRGKANQNPSNEYMKVITEFALFASGFEGEFDKEIVDLINLNF